MVAAAATYPWHGSSRKAFAFSAACLIVSIYTACIAIFRPHNLGEGRALAVGIISALFFAASIGLQIDQRITLDAKARRVSRSRRIWGRWFPTSSWPLSDFTGVNVYRLKAGTPQAPMDLVYVGLLKTNGSTLAIRYFQAGRDKPCPDAEAFASELQRAFSDTAVA